MKKNWEIIELNCNLLPEYCMIKSKLLKGRDTIEIEAIRWY